MLPSPAWPKESAGTSWRRADLERLACDVAEAVERDGDVLAEGAAALRKDRERDAAPPAPQPGDFLRIRRSVNGYRVLFECLAQLAGDPSRLVPRAVCLGDHHERPALRNPERVRAAAVVERGGIEVLDRGRHDARREHALDRRHACVGVAVQADHG